MKNLMCCMMVISFILLPVVDFQPSAICAGVDGNSAEQTIPATGMGIYSAEGAGNMAILKMGAKREASAAAYRQSAETIQVWLSK